MVGNFTLWTSSEQYVKDEEWTPAEHECEKNDSQNLEGRDENLEEENGMKNWIKSIKRDFFS